MFGGVPMQISNQEENVQSNLTSNSNEKILSENNDENMLIDTTQFQLPSTENIAQHRTVYTRDPTSKAIRTGIDFYSINFQLY